MTDDLNDALDDIFGAPTGEVRTATRAPADYTPAVERFEERCPNCRGSGRFVRGRFSGQCFKCKGTGKMVYKTSGTHRANQKQARIERQARNRDQNLADFKTNFPAEWSWLEKTAERWQVAADFINKIAQYGDLTENQMAVITRGIDRDAAREQAKADRIAATPAPVAITVTKLEQAFETAKRTAARPGQMGVMVKPIRLTSGEPHNTFTFTAGSDNSQWHGMIFVKQDGKKLGSIKDGKFTRRMECTDAEAAAIIDCAQDPEKAAVAYGKAWSRCGICGRGLLNDESIARGIGPICAERFGW